MGEPPLVLLPTRSDYKSQQEVNTRETSIASLTTLDIFVITQRRITG